MQTPIKNFMTFILLLTLYVLLDFFHSENSLGSKLFKILPHLLDPTV